MNRFANHILLPLLAFALLCGCTKSASPEQRTAITFDGGWESFATKGLNPMEGTEFLTMGVFVGYESEDETFSSTSLANDYADNVRYSRSLVYLPFEADSLLYWPLQGKLNFFAYAPYISKQYLQPSPSYTSGYPVMVYSPITDISNQPDYCVAQPVLDQHMTLEPIHLYFNHTLSQILFSANYQGRLPATSANLYVKVDEISICNVIGTKQITMSNGTPCFDWQEDSECPASSRVDYLIDRYPSGEISDDSLHNAALAPDNYINISTVYGLMYLLPQTLANGQATLEVSYGLYENVSGAEILRSSVTTSCQLPAVTWEPCKKYRYNFTINLAASNIVNPTVTVEQWQNIDNTSANPTHIE